MVVFSPSCSDGNNEQSDAQYSISFNAHCIAGIGARPRNRPMWQHDGHSSPQEDRPELRKLSRLSKLRGPSQSAASPLFAIKLAQLSALTQHVDSAWQSLNRGFLMAGNFFDQRTKAALEMCRQVPHRRRWRRGTGQEKA
jgi:hypothetical protein